MSTHPRYVALLILAVLLAPMTPTKAAVSAQQDLAAPPTSNSVALNEVMPKAGAGGHEWVELLNIAQTYSLRLPFMVHSCSACASTAAAPAGRSSTLSALLEGIEVSGWQVTDYDGNVYTIPDALPPLPPGAFVVIVADGKGAGADDYDLSDKLATLHTPASLVGIFEDAADQAALYSSSTHSAATLRDFVAWGAEPGDAAADAIASELWPAGAYLEFAASGGYIDPSATWLYLLPNESVGRYAPAALGWAVYRGDQLTPGAPNPVPQPGFYQPEDGAAVDASNDVIGWSVVDGATAYHFQLSTAPSFTTLVADVFSPYPDYHHEGTLAPGSYYWRVRVMGPAGFQTDWTAPVRFDAVDLTPLGTASILAEKTLGLVWQVQHKDTYLLDLSPEGADTRTGEGAWDAPHPADHRVVNHDNHYCQVAAMSMVASFYGAAITQDRLSYYAIREYPYSSRGLDPDRICTDPEHCMPDLKDDFWAGRNKGLEAQVWMLGYAPDDFSDLDSRSYTPPTTTIAFDDIRTWIDAGRPLLVMVPHHMMVIDGYRTGTINQVHLLDPWTAASWKPYTDTGSIQRILAVDAYPVLGTPPAPRSDEASVWTDSDSDGVYDFDEVRRFHTDPFDPDSDGDWVPDKDDIEETVFDNSDTHVYTPEYADWDTDGDRKELDLDNDDDGSPDGCEDTNYNGIYESPLTETLNFDASDNQPCIPEFAILYPLQEDPANAGDPTAPDKILVQVSTAVPAGWVQSYTADDFSVMIGFDTADVISVYPSADTYWLVVAPPYKAAGTYDLSVGLAGQSVTEPYAVTYLTSRPASTVIVLDNSGSMSEDDKITAAQNAASAFIDVLNDGDEVGVVSFSTTAVVDFDLTEILDASVREDAIEAVDSLVPLYTTALGQGAKAGYAEVLSGAPGNRRSLVLLSDGYENEEPYWDEVSPDITEAVVHTVALGEDAQRDLLAQIAGEKHGSFFVVDVEAPPTALSASSVNADPIVIASTLPNRLADVYLAIGELERGRQRMWDAIGPAAEGIPPFPVQIEPGVPEALFTLNWDSPAGYLALSLTDPRGNLIHPDMELRSDTHQQLRVRNPEAGSWTVSITAKGASEYQFTLSGKSLTSLIAAVGGNSQEHAIGKPVPIFGIVSDYKPILGAGVYALVVGPAGSNATFIDLFDDGAHGDAAAGDGLYTALFTPSAAGGYSIKMLAKGTNNSGVEFARFAHAGFHVPYRAAYIWDDDIETAHDYAALLRETDWIADLIHLSHVTATDFSPYGLIIVGYDTGYGYTFDDPEAAATLAQWPAPILGLGDGGAALFYAFGLHIGYSHTWVSDDNIVYPFAPTTSYWYHPYAIDVVSQKLVTLYWKPLRELGVYLSEPIALVTPIAREESNEAHFPVIAEATETGRRFALWGYNLGPHAMTGDGRALLVNVSHALR